jgi:hypothetical protein
MKIFKWVPVANQDGRQGSGSRKNMFIRKEKSVGVKEECKSSGEIACGVQLNEDSNMSQDSHSLLGTPVTSNLDQPTSDNATDANGDLGISRLRDAQRQVSKNLATSWAIDDSSIVDSFQQDDSTRQSQDSNYSDDGLVSGVGPADDTALMANDDSNMSFPPISDNARQSAQDNDADPDMRLALSMVGGQASDESKHSELQYPEPPILEPQMEPPQLPSVAGPQTSMDTD